MVPELTSKPMEKLARKSKYENAESHAESDAFPSTDDEDCTSGTWELESFEARHLARELKAEEARQQLEAVFPEYDSSPRDDTVVRPAFKNRAASKPSPMLLPSAQSSKMKKKTPKSPKVLTAPSKKSRRSQNRSKKSARPKPKAQSYMKSTGQKSKKIGKKVQGSPRSTRKRSDSWRKRIRKTCGLCVVI